MKATYSPGLLKGRWTVVGIAPGGWGQGRGTPHTR
jgi:hypothetical protein